LRATHVVPNIELHQKLIGPSLNEILQRVVGNDPVKISAVLQAFQDHYDYKGYQLTRPYPGIKQLLDHLKKSEKKLYIITNKRVKPTLKILDQLGWAHYFCDIGCPDHNSLGVVLNKFEAIQLLLNQHDISANETMYIGDRFEDFLAANKNKVLFVLAKWGYGETSQFEVNNPLTATSPLVLQKIITRFA